jgi:hypothetical protein
MKYYVYKRKRKAQLDEKEIKWMRLPHEVVQLIS